MIIDLFIRPLIIGIVGGTAGALTVWLGGWIAEKLSDSYNALFYGNTITLLIMTIVSLIVLLWLSSVS